MAKRKAPKKKKKHSFRNKMRPYVQAILSGNAVDIGLFRRLKNEPIEVTSEVFRYFSDQPEALAPMLGVMRPVSVKSYSSNLALPAAKTLKEEIAYNLLLFSAYGGFLKAFTQMRDTFYAEIISGQYIEANGTLKAIIETTGVSLWSLESSLLLAQVTGGIEENRRTYAAMSTEDHPLADCSLDLTSQRVEESLSAAAFEQQVETTYGSDEDSSYIGIQYVRFRALPHECNCLSESLPAVLNIESIHSFVDRLQSTRLILARAASQTELLRDKSLLALLRKAVATTGDGVLAVLSALSDPRLTSIKPLLPTVSYMDALDSYTSGQYENSSRLLWKLLLESPNAFDYYELYAKARIHSGLEPYRGEPKLLRDQVLEDVEIVLRRLPSTDDARKRLAKTALLLSGSSFGGQLLAFCREHSRSTAKQPAWAYYRDAYARYITPRIASSNEIGDNASVITSTIAKVFPDSPTVSIFSSESIDLTDAPENHSQDRTSAIPRTRVLKHSAELHIARFDYDSAAAAYRELETIAGNNPLHILESFSGLVACLLHKGELAEAVKLIVSTYLSQRELVVSVDLNHIALKISGDQDAKSKAGIHWPVFLHIYQSECLPDVDLYDLYVAVDDYLLAAGASRPSKLVLAEGIEREVVTYFLEYLCVTDVLDSSHEYVDEDDLEDERIAICRILQDLVPGRERVFRSEINDRTRASQLRRSLENIGSNKVYVDVIGISRSLGLTFDDQFARLKAYRELEAPMRQYVILLTAKSRLGEDDESTKYPVEVSDRAFDIFKGLLADIRDRYISSNEYGLDSYLSLRIRHGTLAGQIRAAFEEKHLITRHNDDEELYETNNHWLDNAKMSLESDSEKLSNAFDELGRGVDSKISEVKKEWMQIKSPGIPTGMFDFELNRSTMLIAYKATENSETPEDFIDSIFTVLDMMAARCLNAVQSRVKGELRDRLIDELTKLSLVIDELPPESVAELKNDISEARVKIGQACEDIASWFQTVSDAPMSDITLQGTVDAAVEVHRRITVENYVQPSIAIDTEASIRGRHFNYVVDAVQILLDNASRHCCRYSPKVKLIADRIGARVSIRITNTISSKEMAKELASRIPDLNRKGNGDYEEADVSTEGGTGYDKLGRLVKVNLSDLQPLVHVGLIEEKGDSASFEAELSLLLEVQDETCDC